MTFLLPLFLATASADDPTPLRAGVEVGGASASWVVPALDAGPLLRETVHVARRRHAEVAVDCARTEAGDAELRFTVYEVRSRLLGGERRALVGAPVVTLPDARPVGRLVAVDVPFARRGADRRLGRAALVVRVAPVAGGAEEERAGRRAPLDAASTDG